MELVARCIGKDLFWIVGPDYEQARAEFSYFVQAMTALEMIEPDSLNWPKEGSCDVTLLGGTQIITKSAYASEKLGSYAPDGILVVEAGQVEWDVIEMLRGRVGPKRGWIMMTGTLEKAQTWYREKAKAWRFGNTEWEAKSYSLPSWGNLSIYPGGRLDPEIKAMELVLRKEVFAEKIAGEPLQSVLAVWGEFDERVHCDRERARFVREATSPLTGKPMPKPVMLAIDPGWDDPYAVVALQWDTQPNRAYAIDMLYRRHLQTPDIVALCQARPWWPNVRGGVIDVAARHHGSGRPHIEEWLYSGGIALASQPVGIEAGLVRMRSFLREPITEKPRLFINPDTCQELVSEFKAESYQDYEHTKLIDADNHARKAISYWLVHMFGYSQPRNFKRVDNIVPLFGDQTVAQYLRNMKKTAVSV